MDVWQALPEKNRAWYMVFAVLPYENILDIDENGDEWFEYPHIYTTPFHATDGPFRPYTLVSLQTVGNGTTRCGRADESKRIKKFPRKKMAETRRHKRTRGR